jgi:RHS repeat-associated protein
VARHLADRPAGWRTWHADHVARPAGDPEHQAAVKAAAHAGTPTTEHHDPRGRPFVTVAHDGFHPVTSEPLLTATRAWRDAAGHVRVVRDADTRGSDELGRVVARYGYDLLGRRVWQVTLDEGERWVLPDAAGHPIRAGDSRAVHRTTYDAVRRPTEVHVTVAGVERLAERTTYGEALGAALNHRGRVHQVFDAAGVRTNEAYDFKGNLLADRRELLADERAEVDWQTGSPVTGGTFTSGATFDAMNRPRSLTAPDGTVTRPRWNAANVLGSLAVRVAGAAADAVFVAGVDYDARGRRTEIRLGNGARTRYEYDPLTSRLRRLTTTRPGHGDELAPIFATATVVQDLRLTYDPVGNVTQVEDAAAVTVFHAGAQVRPVSEYTYDARYRLVASSGREHIGQTALHPGPPPGSPRDAPFLGRAAHPHDLSALRRYTEDYAYDLGGNLERLRHTAVDGTWTRHFRYTEASRVEPGVHGNRLSATGLGDDFHHAQTFTYTDTSGLDANGSMTSLGSTTLDWDAQNRLRRATLVGGDTVTYVDDASGRRRRVVRRAASGTLREERVHLDGLEIHRRYDATGAVASERRILHVMDDRHRLALVDLPEPGSPSPPAIRYQLGDHLDSATVELDGAGRLVSYEEYHPFGTTSFQAAGAAETSLKRYRFTGKERDEGTGLAHHGARYYAPWLARWTSCDPAGLADGLNAYVYARSRPTTGTDATGRETVTIPEVTVEGRRPDQVAADIQARTGVRAYTLAKALGIKPGGTATWVSDVEERIDAFAEAQEQARAPAAGDDYAGPSIGMDTHSADEMRSQRQARDREEYLREHPNLRSVVMADAQRVSRATGPAGDSISGAAAGAYMLAGQDPATATQKGRLVGAIAGLLPGGRGQASQQLTAVHDAGQAWSSWARAETQSGAPVAPSAATTSATAPTLTYSQGFSLSNDLARAGYTGVFGKYPGNVEYVEAHPDTFTIDRPWGWTPMYNAGGVQGALQANGRFVFTSRTFTGTFRLEAEQVFRAGVQPEYDLR